MSHNLHTLITALLPPTRAVGLSGVTVEQASVRLHLTATAPTAPCPGCAVSSSSLPNRYQRHLTDLPWGARAVPLQLTVRKFRRRNPPWARRGPTRGPPAAFHRPIHTAPPGPGDANPAHARPPGRWGRRVGLAAGSSRRHHPG